MHVSASPSFQTAGNLKVDVAAGPIARMFAAEEWLDPTNAGGGAVFAGHAKDVIENIEREFEPGNAPDGLFNLDAHIYDVASGHPVPYLDVHADVRRGSEQLFSDILLVPVARPRKGAAGLHYGNNVALDPRGRYQVTVTIAPGALSGLSEPTTLEYTLDFDHPDR